MLTKRYVRSLSNDKENDLYVKGYDKKIVSNFREYCDRVIKEIEQGRITNLEGATMIISIDAYELFDDSYKKRFLNW